HLGSRPGGFDGLRHKGLRCCAKKKNHARWHGPWRNVQQTVEVLGGRVKRGWEEDRGWKMEDGKLSCCFPASIFHLPSPHLKSRHAKSQALPSRRLRQGPHGRRFGEGGNGS